MPGQLLSQPNPPPDPSLLPDSVLDYAVKLDTTDFLSKDEHRAIHLFRRAADYIAAGAHILTLLTHINKYPFQQ
jgi:xylulose-5-phosphate/fructose-6-phosphate phosphoketolase